MKITPPRKPVSSPRTANPALVELVTGIADRKAAGIKGRSWMKSLDAFGTHPRFRWNSERSYQTKLGSMCTTFCVLALGFVTYIYFSEFILCLDPKVNITTKWGPIEKGAPQNDLNLLFAPAFRAIHYRLVPVPTAPPTSIWTLEYPSSQVLDCHFNFYALVETDHDLFTPSLPVKVPIKRDCDNTWEKWNFLKSGNVTRQMISTFYCFDIPKMPIYGDLPWCTSNSCQWYTLNVELKKHSDRVGCPVSLDPDLIFINFVGAQSFSNVTNFDEPWTMNEST
jgi:hypothetical protein